MSNKSVEIAATKDVNKEKMTRLPYRNLIPFLICFAGRIGRAPVVAKTQRDSRSHAQSRSNRVFSVLNRSYIGLSIFYGSCIVLRSVKKDSSLLDKTSACALLCFLGDTFPVTFR
jgi:hypothetical protein